MRAPAFDDLLDEHLAAALSPLSTSWAPGPSGTASAYGFFFGPSSAVVGRAVGNHDLAAAGPTSCASTIAQRVSSQVEERSTPYASAPEPAAAASPIIEPVLQLLSTAERAALAEMNALGANLSPTFRLGELRRAFRRLALRYHPDRHTSRSADERAQLSERFTRARGAYQILVGVLARRS